MVTKINPVFVADQPRSFLTKSISTFTVTVTGANISGDTAPGENIDKLIKTVGLSATIVAHSDVTDATPSVVGFWLEGEFPDDTFDGTNVESFAAHLEDTIQALGAPFATTAVAAGPVFKADQV